MPEVHRGVNLTGKLRVLGFCQRLVKNKSPFLSIMRYYILDVSFVKIRTLRSHSNFLSWINGNHLDSTGLSCSIIVTDKT